MDKITRAIAALLGTKCPFCLDFEYFDSDGNLRIVFDLCEYHKENPDVARTQS